jgi:hypothetical protein
MTHENEQLEKERLLLHKEAEELTLIFATILRKLENKGN